MRRWPLPRVVLAAASCVLTVVTMAGAQDRIIDRWGVEQGMLNYATSDILQGRNGYLWIATWAGLSRFDGVRFTPIAEDLPNAHARALFEDRDGYMWIGVPGTGLARWRDGRFTTITPAEGLAGVDVRAFVQDPGGLVWAATEAGLSVIGERVQRTLRVAEGLPDRNVTDLAVSRDGRVWVATAAGVCVASAAHQRCLPVPGAPASGADAIVEDRDGRVWIGSRRGITVLNGTARPLGGCPGRCLEDTDIAVLLVTARGDVWAGFDGGGVARVHDGGIERLGEVEGLPAGQVVSLEEDLEGSVWVGIYYGGLARIKPKRVRTYATADGLPTPAIGSIVQDQRGDIWAGSQCGPRARLVGDRFVPQFVDTLGDACAWILLPARDGSLWIGTRGQGLYRWDGARLTRFTPDNGLADASIMALFEDRDGTVWIGTEFGGVQTFSGGVLSREYTEADGLATKWVAAIGQDATGASGSARTPTASRSTRTAGSGFPRTSRRATSPASIWTAVATCGSAAPPKASSATATAGTSRSVRRRVLATGSSPSSSRTSTRTSG